MDSVRNRGCKDALRRVDHLLHHGYTWVVDADLKSYFDTIPQEKLLARVADKVSDGRVLHLVQAYSAARGAGGSKILDAGTGNAAGRSDQSAVIEHLS